MTVTIASNTATDILSFDFPGLVPGSPVIDTVNHTVTIEVAYGTDITNLTPVITVSGGAGINPASGVAQDFANLVTYSVTAEDGVTTQVWVVTATIAPNTATDILSFSFPEQTTPSTIDDVKHTVDVEVASGTDVTNLVATFTLSPGALAQLNATDQVSVSTSNDFTNPETYTITAEDGVTVQEWVVSVTLEPDEIDPEITSSTLPETFTAGSSGIKASVTASDNVGIEQVSFYSRIANESTFTTIDLTSSNDAFEHTITQGSVTDIGMEYFFLVSDGAGNTISSDTILIVIEYSTETGPDIPNLSTGGQPENWRMFSIPFVLKDNKVATMFESKLGTYDKSKWRIVHYKNDAEKFIEYRQGLSVVERGKGYWLNSVQPANIPMVGKASVSTRGNLSTINLQKGWNQIGNPYTFDVSWPDILTFNNATGIGGLRIYTGGTSLVDSNVLKAYGGAYVFVDNAITLQIPMGNESTSTIEKQDNEGDWILNFTVESGQFRNLISGLGMKYAASDTKDRFDKIRVPRYNKYIDITFEHEEYYAPDFAMDIVPVSDRHTWDFYVGTNVNNTHINLSWDAPKITKGMRLMLYDKGNNILIDMMEETAYRFESSAVKGLKVIYGDESYLSDELDKQNVLLGKNFPNPFDDNTTIPFTIIDNKHSYQVKLTVYSLDGVEVNVLVNKKLSHGTYAIEWDQTDHAGNRVAPGVYIYQLEVTSPEERLAISEKMILK